MFEGGAILVYLADKTGQFIGTNAAERAEVMTWLMWQMGGLGPMFGQMGFFHKFVGSEIEDPRPKQRYLDENKRLLTVLDGHLEGRDWVAGDYSIADMAIAPWLRALDFYGTKELLGFDGFKNVSAYLDRFLARDAVQRGLIVPPREPAQTQALTNKKGRSDIVQGGPSFLSKAVLTAQLAACCFVYFFDNLGTHGFNIFFSQRGSARL